MGQIDSKPLNSSQHSIPGDNNVGLSYQNSSSITSSPKSASGQINSSPGSLVDSIGAQFDLSNSTSSLNSNSNSSSISAYTINNIIEFLNGPFQDKPPSPPISPEKLSSTSNIEIIKSVNNLPPPLEPEEIILSKIPYLLPLISHSTRTEFNIDRILNEYSTNSSSIINNGQPNNNNSALKSLDIDPMYRILSTFKNYLEFSTVGISSQQDKLNQKIKEIDVLCTKAHQLMYKHANSAKQNLSTLPDINKLSEQIQQSQQTMNTILNSIDSLTRFLPDQHNEFIEFSESLKKSPINRQYSDNIDFTPHQSNSILKNVSISNFISKVKNDKQSIWITDIIPKISTIAGTSKMRDLVRKGIDKEVRGLVWQNIIGNQLNLTQDTYWKMVESSAGILQNYNDNLGSHHHYSLDKGNSPTNNEYLGKDIELLKHSIGYNLSMIEMDLPRTFASFSLVNNESSQFRKQLQRILMSFVNYLPDIGYVQGMSYLGAIFLLHMDEYQSWVSLCNLIENQKFLQSLFQLDMKKVDKYLVCFQEMFLNSNQKLYNHFEAIGLIPQYYLIQWWLTVFVQSVPLNVAIRIWDCFVSEGYIFLFITSLGLLFHYRKILEENNLEYCKTFLSNLPQDLDADSLFKSIDHINATYCSQLLHKLETKPSDELELTSYNSEDLTHSSESIPIQNSNNHQIDDNNSNNKTIFDNINYNYS
ncbi:regulator of chromosome condensation domain-containing protein [Tieghemostelium lacteum]|uniref:Regulator of chromosome condensation domain-containing protein n=1 Tax=Tieghemostelium lacteum TaxID=361077 RepID=A0A151ZJ21_TIELA|nr:regulator of chromosome condensation domain-containing protein [Tieghemostelium lacteum]|eukprot:KYQ93991.1 regulator of chromosome condensation domain-containing protein [Tieghemostelium lacteum]